MIEARDLVKEYESGGVFRAVDGVSLDVARGEMVLIIGPNGSGKTTLLSMLGGLVRPTRGSVRVDGQLVDHDLEEFRLRKVGFVFQTFRLLDALSVRENVQLVLDLARSPRNADEMLERVGASHLAQRNVRALTLGAEAIDVDLTLGFHETDTA